MMNKGCEVVDERFIGVNEPFHICRRIGYSQRGGRVSHTVQGESVWRIGYSLCGGLVSDYSPRRKCL